jgi:carbamate kinase
MEKLVVIAIGGNSLIQDSEHMSVFDQYKAAGETSKHIVTVIEQGYRVVVTHGNGPQVGFILLRSEMAREILHEVPLDSCGADTQGAIGYKIMQTLNNAGDTGSGRFGRPVVFVSLEADRAVLLGR